MGLGGLSGWLEAPLGAISGPLVMFSITMPTSPELRKEISDRAERRNREIFDALGGGLLSKNKQYFNEQGMLNHFIKFCN